MEADPTTLLDWLGLGELELQLTSLEYLCNEILFSDASKFLRRYNIGKFVRAMIQIFSDDMAPDDLLEANARTLTYCLEVPGVERLRVLSDMDYKIICVRLDIVDMTSPRGSEVGQQIIKLLDVAVGNRQQNVYCSEILTSVLRFVQFYSECVHADVIQAGMNIIRTLSQRCEPRDPAVDVWIESLTALLDHRDNLVVVNYALQALASIVNRFIRAGQDPTQLATSALIECLSSHLYKASIGGYSDDAYSAQSNVDFSESHISMSDSQFHIESRAGTGVSSAGGSASDRGLVNSLTNLLLALCCSSAVATQFLLQSENRLASALATILLNWGDETILTNVYRLLEVIIVILGRESNGSRGVRSRGINQRLSSKRIRTNSAGTATEEKGSVYPRQATILWERLCGFRAAVELIKKHDAEGLSRLLSDGTSFDHSDADSHGQTLLNWASSFGSPEIVKLLCTQSGADVEAGARTCLDYASTFGCVDACRVLLSYGAKPDAVDADGLSVLDKARLSNYPNSEAIVKMLEDHISESTAKVTSQPQNTPPSIVSFVRECPSHTHPSSRMRSLSTTSTPLSPSESLFIFASELLPVLISAFAKTQSEAIRYQTMLLLRQLIDQLDSRNLQTIGLFRLDGVTLSFRLSMMIYTALSEESENTLLCALQLCQHLLMKLRDTYMPHFHRLGILSLVKSIHSVMQHHQFWGSGNQEENGETSFNYNEDSERDDPQARCSTSCFFSEDEATSESEGEENAAASAQAEEEGEEEELDPDTGELNDVDGILLEECAPKPLISASVEVWNDWAIVMFGNLLFIYSRYAMVQFEMNCPNNEMRAIFVLAENGAVPVEFRTNLEPIERPGMRNEMLRLMHQIYNCFGFNSQHCIIREWPQMYYYHHYSRLQRKRAASESRPTTSECSYPRRSSLPSLRTFSLPDEYLYSDFSVNSEFKFHYSPRVVRAGNLVLDMVKSDTDIYFLRVRTSAASSEMVLFSPCQQAGFLRATAFPSMVDAIQYKLENSAMHSQPSVPPNQQVLTKGKGIEDHRIHSSVILMEGRVWDVRYRSGWLEKSLFNNEDNQRPPLDNSRLVRFQIRHIAWRLSTSDLVHPVTPSPSPLKSAPPLPQPVDTRLPQEFISYMGSSSISCLESLTQIATDIVSLTKQRSANVRKVLDSLTASFQSIANVLRYGEEAITFYELSTSSLVHSLLVCLSPSKAVEWFNVIDSDDESSHIDFLHLRRRTFFQVFKSTSTLQTFIHCLVNCLDHTERLPINLFEHIPYFFASKRLKSSSINEINPPIPNKPFSCPPKAPFTELVFTFSNEPVFENISPVFPLGLLAPTLPSRYYKHNLMTAGGVRGLVDMRVNRLLGAWLPLLSHTSCTGRAGMMQIQQFCTLVTRRQVGFSGHFESGGDGANSTQLFFPRSLPGGISTTMITSSGRYRNRIKQSAVKEWYNLRRQSLAFLHDFFSVPNHSISLRPDSPQDLPTPITSNHKTLKMSLFRWLGTQGGILLDNWKNPASINLITLTSSPANNSKVWTPTYAIDPVIPSSRYTHKKSHHEKLEEPLESCLLDRKQIGARVTIDLGLQLIPTAYVLASLRREGTGTPVRNWCLQATNDLRNWTTLSLHRNCRILNGLSVTIHLKPSEFEPWTSNIVGNAFTSAMTRPLATVISSDNESTDSLVVSAVSTDSTVPLDLATSKEERSWRIFRLMDLTPLDKQNDQKLIVHGFDLFGTVTSVHSRLLPGEQISRRFTKFITASACQSSKNPNEEINLHDVLSGQFNDSHSISPSLMLSNLSSLVDAILARGSDKTVESERNSHPRNHLLVNAYSNVRERAATLDMLDLSVQSSSRLRRLVTTPLVSQRSPSCPPTTSEPDALEETVEMPGTSQETDTPVEMLDLMNDSETHVPSITILNDFVSPLTTRVHLQSSKPSSHNEIISLDDLFDNCFLPESPSSPRFYSLNQFGNTNSSTNTTMTVDDSNDDDSVFESSREHFSPCSSSTDTHTATDPTTLSSLPNDTTPAASFILERMKQFVKSDTPVRFNKLIYANSGTFRLAPGLIAAFDPSSRNIPASSEYSLLIKPDANKSIPAGSLQQNKYDIDLELKLVSRSQNGTVMASVLVDDDNTPIFKYIVELAERTVYVEQNSNLLADPPHAKISLEYSVPSKEPQLPSNHQETGDSLAFLTSRDARLVNSQENALHDILGNKSERNLGTICQTEELLELLHIVAQLADVSSPKSHLPIGASSTVESPDTSIFSLGHSDIAEQLLPNPLSSDDFISHSLTRKLLRQLVDLLAISAGPSLPDWCVTLPRRIRVLFPYEARYRLFRACAFGPARSVIWLHKHLSALYDNEEPLYNEERTNTTVNDLFQRTEARRLAANVYSYLNDKSANRNRRFHRLSSTSSQRRRISSGSSTDFDSGLHLHSSTAAHTSLVLDALCLDVGNCRCRLVEAGRLHKEFVRIPRDNAENAGGGGFWEWAERVLDEHAERKSELEIQFMDEEGTGIGPTLEFFSLLALEFRLKSSQMWLSEEGMDAVTTTGTLTAEELDVNQPTTSSHLSAPQNETTMAPSYSPFVNSAMGLFPTPYSCDSVPLAVLRRFYIMGIAVGKCLQDNRLIDLHLSTPFLKLITCPRISQNTTGSDGQPPYNGLRYLAHVEALQERIKISPDPILFGHYERSSSHWLTGILDFDDFTLLQPERGRFFANLSEVYKRHQRIKKNCPPNDQFLQQRLDNASIEVIGCTIDDLCIDMEFIPAVATGGGVVRLMDTYPWESPDAGFGDNAVESVSNDNIHVYIRRTLEFCLDKGIRAQMDAFKAGFERVFSMQWLAVFTSHEASRLISGESGITWSRADLLTYTVPCLGYTKTSQTFLLFVDVLNDLNAEERRDFLRFTTGCSSLPPGGFRGLNPRLRVVRKDASEGPFPSVNTCVHYLKLPEYSSKEELRHYLLAAMHETGFYLN